MRSRRSLHPVSCVLWCVTRRRTRGGVVRDSRPVVDIRGDFPAGSPLDARMARAVYVGGGSGVCKGRARPFPSFVYYSIVTIRVESRVS